MAKTARCRSCNAAIIWTVTEGGKKMPVDETTDRNGRFWIAFEGFDDPIAYYDKDGRIADEFRRGVTHLEGPYVSHFATCPNATTHRKPKPSQTSIL